MTKLNFLCFFLCMITYIRSARILAVFPTPSISHQVVFRPITQELAKRGHEIVIITPDPAFPKGQSPMNLTEIDVHDVSYSIWNKQVAPAEGEERDWLKQMEVMFNLLQLIVEDQIKTDEVKILLSHKNDHFDLLLLEACVRPVLGFSHVFKAPVIQISSLGSLPHNIVTVGAVSHPILYPSFIRDRLYNLTMWEKLVQVIKEVQYMSLLNKVEIKDNNVIKTIFGENVPPLTQLYNNVEMFFLNVNPIWENNRPVPPNVIYMGGLHQRPEKELPQDLKSYLDASNNGVIYFSLGTNVKPSLLPPGKLQVIINVFARLPYNILMKWDCDDLQGYSKNVKVSKWFPQSDILRNPKVKLFITQGGLQSTDEAITAGVPLIAIPMLADQWYNAEKYVYHKIGLKLDIQSLTEEELETAIKTVIENKSYGQNIVKLREIIQDQPQKPLDRTIWWIEYVLRHGGARHLRSPAANITWAEYLELKLLVPLAIIFLITQFILLSVVKSIFSFFPSII